jgi:Mrp family chromosome partitioning ATPase
VLHCLAIGPTQGLLLALQQMSAQLEEICLLKALDRFPDSHEGPRLLNALDPEAVFLEIHPSVRCLELARELRDHYPQVLVVGYARHLDKARKEEAQGAGIAEILVAPFSIEDLQLALVQADRSRPPEIHHNLAAILPAKPGTGASRNALESAVVLAGLGRQVLVVDADRQNGVLALYAGVSPRHSLDEVLDISHELNKGAWEYRRTRAEAYDLLPAPRRPTHRSYAPWAYRKLLRFLTSRYDHVLVDLAGVPTDGSEAFLRQARTIRLVTAPDEASQFLVERRREELAALGIAAERIEVLERRPHPEDEAVLPSGGLFSALRRRVLAHALRERQAG